MSFYAGTNVQVGPFTFHIGKAFDFSLQNMSAPLVPGIDYSIGTITQAEAARNYLRVTDRIDESYSTGLGLDEFRARVQIASNVSTELLKLVNEDTMLAIGAGTIQASYLDMLDTWSNRANEVGGEYLPRALSTVKSAKQSYDRFLNGGLTPQDKQLLWSLYYVFNPEELAIIRKEEERKASEAKKALEEAWRVHRESTAKANRRIYRNIIIMVAIFGLGLFAIFMRAKYDEGEINKRLEAEAIESVDMIAGFIDNAAKAERNWTGRAISIVGKIERMERQDTTGLWMIELEGKGPANTVRCVLTGGEDPSIDGYRRRVLVRGWVQSPSEAQSLIGYKPGWVALSPCRIIKAMP